jgi:hypothetical protein
MGVLRGMGRELERRWEYWMHDSGRRRRLVGKGGSVSVGLFALCCVFGGCVSFGRSGDIRQQTPPAAAISAPAAGPLSEPAEAEANSFRGFLAP